MSSSLYFYRVSRVKEDLPEIINLDKRELEYCKVTAEDAKDWEKDTGIIRTIEYSTIDFFDVGEKLFGVKPTSITLPYNYYLEPNGTWSDALMYFEKEETKRVSKAELEKYRYNKQYLAYIYSREDIARIDYTHGIKTDDYVDRPLKKKDILDIAKKLVDKYTIGDYFPGDEYPLLEIMKVYFTMKSKDCIVCCME